MAQRSLHPPRAGTRICGQHCLQVMRCIFGSMSEIAQLMNSFLSCQTLAMPTCCRLQWHVNYGLNGVACMPLREIGSVQL